MSNDKTYKLLWRFETDKTWTMYSFGFPSVESTVVKRKQWFDNQKRKFYVLVVEDDGKLHTRSKYCRYVIAKNVNYPGHPGCNLCIKEPK